jgi:hypothetical protein
MTSQKCTSVVAHFKGLAHAPVLWGVHCPMQHVQGYSRSHWTPPLGNYSLCIALAAARATANKIMMKKCSNFAGHFDGHDSALVGYCAHCPMEEVQGYVRCHWLLLLDEYCGQ